MADANEVGLRDKFALAAMQGIVGSIDSEGNYLRIRDIARREGMTVSQWIARDAYKQADAMVAARSADASQLALGLDSAPLVDVAAMGQPSEADRRP